MVLAVDNDSKKIIATLHNGDRIEEFECRISACQNPVCTCGTAYLHLIPILTKNGNARHLSPRNVEIDIDEKSLECRDKKKKWETIEKGSPSLNLNSVRSAIESQHPNIYKLFQKRHVKLKTIYSHCKKRHYAPKQELQLTKVGRNDPCPCGSGIKYKKCCLTRSK